MGASLVTRTEYKAYAGIASTNEDAKIDVLIPKISDMVKYLCRTTFVDYVNEDKVEYFEGPCSSYIPQEAPIITISSLEYSTDYGSTYTELVEYTDYVISQSTGTIKPVSGTEFPYRVNGYKLIYSAGYETLPEALKLAVFDLITYYLKNDGAIHSKGGVGANTLQIEYVTNTNLPASIKRVLDLYANNYN